jgi:hypothetical protein
VKWSAAACRLGFPRLASGTALRSVEIHENLRDQPEVPIGGGDAQAVLHGTGGDPNVVGGDRSSRGSKRSLNLRVTVCRFTVDARNLGVGDSRYFCNVASFSRRQEPCRNPDFNSPSTTRLTQIWSAISTARRTSRCPLIKWSNGVGLGARPIAGNSVVQIRDARPGLRPNFAIRPGVASARSSLRSSSLAARRYSGTSTLTLRAPLARRCA